MHTFMKVARRCSRRDSDDSIISLILELVEHGRPTATHADKLVRHFSLNHFRFG